MEVALGSEVKVPLDEASVLAFDAFYRKELRRSVRRIALIAGSVPAAEDIVHEAMAQVYRRWASVDDPAAYLHRSAVNGAFRWLRSTRRESPAPEQGAGGGSSSSEYFDLVDLLASLTARQRAAVVLRYYDGLTEREIARILGCRPGSVGPMLSRAHEVLRREFSS
jgi:RNA polymerase sigma factor (sigma-70 family)